MFRRVEELYFRLVFIRVKFIDSHPVFDVRNASLKGVPGVFMLFWIWIYDLRSWSSSTKKRYAQEWLSWICESCCVQNKENWAQYETLWHPIIKLGQLGVTAECRNEMKPVGLELTDGYTRDTNCRSILRTQQCGVVGSVKSCWWYARRDRIGMLLASVCEHRWHCDKRPFWCIGQRSKRTDICVSEVRIHLNCKLLWTTFWWDLWQIRKIQCRVSFSIIGVSTFSWRREKERKKEWFQIGRFFFFFF